jgi:hypothetical protein
MEIFVIPAEAGIQYFHTVKILWIPVFTGMTTFYETINDGISTFHYSMFLLLGAFYGQ